MDKTFHINWKGDKVLDTRPEHQVAGDSFDAEITYGTETILIRNGAKHMGRHSVKENLVHEIVHMLDHYMLGSRMPENDVETFGFGLAHLIRVNPQLFKYLGEK